MNGDSSAHCHQPDLCSAFLHTDPPLPPSLPPSRARTPSLQDLFEMNGINIQQTPSNVTMDVLDNLMANATSGAGGPPSSMPASAASSSQSNQQMLVEQQMRLNQLQQLYQLQTQIFQQQVSAAPSHQPIRLQDGTRPPLCRAGNANVSLTLLYCNHHYRSNS